MLHIILFLHNIKFIQNETQLLFGFLKKILSYCKIYRTFRLETASENGFGLVTAVTSVVQNGKIVVFIARHNTVEKFNIEIDEEKLEIPTKSYKKIMSDNYLSYSTLKAFKVDDIIFCSGVTQCGDLIFYQGTSRENYVNYI